jgi:hypothetical protein
MAEGPTARLISSPSARMTTGHICLTRTSGERGRHNSIPDEGIGTFAKVEK